MRNVLRHMVATGWGLASVLGSSLALACPVCAERGDGGLMSNVALGAMVLSPWMVALSVGLWIKRVNRDETAEDST
ncbi:MAG: hypothetical protein VB934_12555 [Polyangiaceae bacterium]